MNSIIFHQGVTIGILTGWCLIATGVGRLCLGITAIRFASRSEEAFLSTGLGLIVTGYAVFILGVTQLLNTIPMTILLIFLGALALRGWFRSLPAPPPLYGVRSAWDRPASYLLGIVLLGGFFLVLTPETGKDALIYHLAVPKLYLRHHGFYFIPGNIFAGYPLLGEMHYLLALFFQDDVLAKAMHFAVFCWILLGIGLFIRHLLPENAFPALSMLIFASIPSVFSVSHMAYNDLFVTLFTLSAVYAFSRWSAEKTQSWLILCSLFSGAAAASKYTALFLPLIGTLGILVFSRRQGQGSPRVLRTVMLYAVVAFATGCPFYLKNWITAGNPVYPFFHEIFGARGWDADQARLYDLFIRNLGMGRTLTDYLLLPWNLSFRARMDSPQFDGILGPVFLLTLPFLIGIHHWKTPLRILVAYAVLTFLFWASSAQQIRYLLPLFPLLALVTGTILTRYHTRKRIFGLLILIIAASLSFSGYHLFQEWMKISPVRVAVGLESREDFLTRTIPTYAMYRFVNRELPTGSRVFLIYMKNYTFLCDHACYSDAMFEAHTLQKTLRWTGSAAGIRDRLKEEGFTHLLYDATYLLGEPSPLSIEEKKLFLDFQTRYLTTIIQEGPYHLDRLI